MEKKIDEVRKAGESIDYLTFAPDGEPTLDINLGREIDLLSIIAVHPMREEAERELLARAKADESIIQQLIARNLLFETEYENKKFYLRKLPERSINRTKLLTTN
jgi:wyosine [tRNA(Phe)-imidazoG37] synthetase (radical SAM superfamily)